MREAHKGEFRGGLPPLTGDSGGVPLKSSSSPSPRAERGTEGGRSCFYS